MARTLSPETHRAIEDATDVVLYDEGLHAATVDAICARAGVGKPALYRHFGNRDTLVLDYLDRRRHRRLSELDAAVARAEPSGSAPAMAVVDWIAEWIVDEAFRGCGFHRALQQRPSGQAEVVETTRAFKDAVEARLRTHLSTAGVAAPDGTARPRFLLAEGALAAAAYRPSAAVAADLRTLARRVLGCSAD